jgi:hypothetical protein
LAALDIDFDTKEHQTVHATPPSYDTTRTPHHLMIVHLLHPFQMTVTLTSTQSLYEMQSITLN